MPDRVAKSLQRCYKDGVNRTLQIEEVAIAIFQSDVAHGLCAGIWADESERDKKWYREDALAAIEAYEAVVTRGLLKVILR